MTKLTKRKKIQAFKKFKIDKKINEFWKKELHFFTLST